MLDIVKRAATGLGGRRSNRPRGVAFLAGPTGVGKTELAKTITELLFGDESAYIRFNMSSSAPSTLTSDSWGLHQDTLVMMSVAN
jgi:ATP-dependent Clp protease ATP-binding subunit ClpA